MTKKRGLGRGLDSLIPTITPADEERGAAEVAVNLIDPNPHQPRTNFDQESLETLADSINEHGLIQPLIVQKTGDGRFTLIAGERRWRAAKITGMSHVPVIVKDATPQSSLEIALIENIQRADLNALEEAHAYQQLIEEFELTQEEVARRVGKSRPMVANMVRLLNLPMNIQAAVADERISGGHARALLPLPTPETQTAVMQNIIKRHLSVRQTEAIVRKMLDAEKPKPKATRKLPPELAELESQFRDSLGTRVIIKTSGKGGRVIIHYYSDEELHAIYEAIVGED